MAGFPGVYGQSQVDRQSPVAYKEPHFRGESFWSGTPPRRPHQMRLRGCDCRMALISGQIRTAAPRASPRLICQGHPRPAMPMFHAQTLIWCMRACVHARMQACIGTCAHAYSDRCDLTDRFNLMVGQCPSAEMTPALYCIGAIRCLRTPSCSLSIERQERMQNESCRQISSMI